MKIKICGIKTVEAARAAADNGADFLGFIFYDKSRRYVAPEKAAVIAKEVGGAKKVGVFVDAPFYFVNDVAVLCDLDFVQLHGHESAEYAKKINRSVIKAFRYGDDFSVEAANAYPAEIVLIDTFKKGEAGGTGEKFNWQRAAEDCEKLMKPLLVAGGISAANAKEAHDLFRPFGLDVSGSLEENGEKSVEKITAFMDYLKKEKLI